MRSHERSRYGGVILALLLGACEAPSGSPDSLGKMEAAATQLPAKFDWRSNSGNFTTPIKEQGVCLSCWSFSIAAMI